MRFTKTVPYKLKRLVPMLGLAGATMFTACDKENEPVINPPHNDKTDTTVVTPQPHYNVELFFNNIDVDFIHLDTIKKHNANPLVDTIYMIPDDKQGIGGAFTGFGPNALHNVRLFLEDRVNASPKVRGRGDLVFSNNCVFQADSLWFEKQGWAVKYQENIR